MSPKKLSRRQVLKAAGVTLALPWLESNQHLFAQPIVKGTKEPPKRFAFLFFGDGIHPPQWWAKGQGAQMELGPAFSSLESVKEKVNIINGLKHPGAAVSGHARGAAGILTGVQPLGGREIRAAVSMDQILAQKLQNDTAISSLVLACERPVTGFHESGYSMLYASHISWSTPVSPVPSELYPSLAFDNLFESQGSQADQSILDHVLDQLIDVTGKVSKADKRKLDEYSTSIREVEKRLARIQKQQNEKTIDPKSIDEKRPSKGLPTEVDEHTRLMCDILALAFQTDRTRIATMLLTNNLSGQIYPFLGLRDDHHSFSHACQNKEYAAITKFWVDQYGYLLNKLDSIQEGEGTVLDNSLIVMANEQWTAHYAKKIPLITGGGLGGEVKTGRTLDYEKSKDRKLSSFYLSVMDRMGVRLPQFGDSKNRLSEF